MTRDPRFDILFESMKIGPVTAKNRFYQVPHCNGGGYRDPSAVAEMRKIKEQVGFDGDLQAFMQFMREDKQFIYAANDDGRARYLREATALIDTMKSRLDELFIELNVLQA